MPTFTGYPALQGYTADIPAAMQRGTQNAQMNQLRQIKIDQARNPQADPRLALDREKFELSKDKDERAQAMQKLEQIGGLLAPFADPGMPEIKKPQMWPQMLRQAEQMGLPIDSAPPQYDPQWVAMTMGQVGKYQAVAAAQPPSGYRKAEGGGLEFTPGGPADPAQAGRLATAKRAAESAGEGIKAPAGYRWLGKGLEPIPGGEHDPKSTKNRFKRSTKLRNEFTKASGDWIKVRDAAARVEESAKDPSAAGDLSMIFNYMKVLDPGSVVRESEFATAAASGSWGDRVAAAGAKIMSGERLSDDQRDDFLDRSRRLATAQYKQQVSLAKEYTDLSNRSDVSPDNVVVNYTKGFSPYGSAETPSSTGDVNVSKMGVLDLVKMLDQENLSQQKIDEIDKHLKELGY